MPAFPRNDSTVRTARREAIVAMSVWAAATVYSLSVCGWLGYGRDPATLKYVFGFPDWVFWGLIVPWLVCVGISWWFAYGFIADTDLGDEAEDMSAISHRSHAAGGANSGDANSGEVPRG